MTTKRNDKDKYGKLPITISSCLKNGRCFQRSFPSFRECNFNLSPWRGEEFAFEPRSTVHRVLLLKQFDLETKLQWNRSTSALRICKNICSWFLEPFFLQRTVTWNICFVFGGWKIFSENWEKSMNVDPFGPGTFFHNSCRPPTAWITNRWCQKLGKLGGMLSLLAWDPNYGTYRLSLSYNRVC